MAIFSNQATLSYNNNVTNSNIVTGELLEVLSAEKTAAQESYTNGDTVTYVVNIINSGTADYNGLTVTDDLGEYTVPSGTGTATPLTYIDGTARYFVNGVLQTAPAAEAGPPLVISGINVPAGGNAAIVYSARANGFAPLETNGAITNTARVSGAGLASDVIASSLLNVDNEPNLSINKSVTPVSVVGGGPLTYTFVISNTGNTAADAEDNIVVSDTFNPILDITGVTYDGVALTEGTDYTYDRATGLFTTAEGRLTVPAAVYEQDNATGATAVTPGTGTLTVTGTIV